MLPRDQRPAECVCKSCEEPIHPMHPQGIGPDGVVRWVWAHSTKGGTTRCIVDGQFAKTIAEPR